MPSATDHSVGLASDGHRERLTKINGKRFPRITASAAMQQTYQHSENPINNGQKPQDEKESCKGKAYKYGILRNRSEGIEQEILPLDIANWMG